ncbi:MAG: DUF5667 domain-containing protein [Marmoricola sp.]
MTSLFPAARAAEEFDRVLAGDAAPSVAERHSGLLATVEVLRAQPELTARAEFVGDLRERLMLAARTELVAVPVSPRLSSVRTPAPRTGHRKLGSIAASLVILGGSAGMAAAAAGALPGDSLYPIKRGSEKLNAALRLNEASKGRLLLSQAETRLAEVSELVSAGADPALVARTVSAFNAAADTGADKLFVSFQREGDPTDITAVREFTTQQMSELGRMNGASDAATGTSLVEAADTLADIDQAARVLCRTCGPAAPVAPPNGLSAGAAAASFESLLTSPVSHVQDVLDTNEVAALQRAAEAAAGRTPSATSPDKSASGPGQEPVKPVRGTFGNDGKLLPSVGVDATVKDLVTGVTGTVKGLADSGEKTKTAGDDVAGIVDGLGETVNGVTDSLLP